MVSSARWSDSPDSRSGAHRPRRPGGRGSGSGAVKRFDPRIRRNPRPGYARFVPLTTRPVARELARLREPACTEQERGRAATSPALVPRPGKRRDSDRRPDPFRGRAPAARPHAAKGGKVGPHTEAAGLDARGGTVVDKTVA